MIIIPYTIKVDMHYHPLFANVIDQVWLGLEWSLLIFTIIAFIVNVLVFILVSIVTCRPCHPRNKMVYNSCISNQTEIIFIIIFFYT